MAPPHGNRKPSPGVKPLKSSTPSKKRKPQTPKPKPNSVKSQDQKDVSNPSSALPLDLQQLVLNIFKDSFSSRYDEDLPSLIQKVKKCLYDRDFGIAFGREEYLEAYAMRWSAGRALGYLGVLCGIPDLLDVLLPRSRVRSRESGNGSGTVNRESASPGEASTGLPGAARILCLGGGAGAEVVALAGCIRYLDDKKSGRGRSLPAQEKVPVRIKATVVDIADWSSIVDKLYSSITTPPTLSQYATATAKVGNVPLVDPSTYEVQFLKHDLLNMEVDQLAEILKGTTLVTLMFTLNELYSTSMSATTNLLLAMTFLLFPGTLLLVVDSPGSYSTVAIGKASEASTTGDAKAEKKYPMQWLLDHTLLESAAIGSSKNSMQERQWEKVESHDSRWFRLREELRYPLDLEDMRYQIHLYRRL